MGSLVVGGIENAVLTILARCTPFSEPGRTLMKRTAEATESRHAKLASMGKSSYVSQAGVETLCTPTDQEGMPTAFSRSTQHRTRKSVCDARTPYGLLVESEAVVGKNGSESMVSEPRWR